MAWVSSVAGIWLSFRLDVSTGGTIVLVQAAVFTVVWTLGPREGLVPTAVRRRRRAARRPGAAVRAASGGVPGPA